DVERRSRRRRQLPTRAAAVVAVAIVAVTVTAVAFGLPQTVIDFFDSPPAPAHIKNWFGAENVGVLRGMSPKAIPGQARKIATATFDANRLEPVHPSVHTLYVAPRKGGGFCWLWTNADGGCLPAKPTRPLGLTWYGNDYVVLLNGWVHAGATK